MGCYPSHWRTPSFFKMVKSTNQHKIDGNCWVCSLCFPLPYPHFHQFSSCLVCWVIFFLSMELVTSPVITCEKSTSLPICEQLKSALIWNPARWPRFFGTWRSMAGAKPLAERGAVHVVLLLSESANVAATGDGLAKFMAMGRWSVVNGITTWLMGQSSLSPWWLIHLWRFMII